MKADDIAEFRGHVAQITQRQPAISHPKPRKRPEPGIGGSSANEIDGGHEQGKRYH